MSFQTRKTFDHLQTQIKMFLMKTESSIDSNATDMFPGPET